jgi:hypothetical protein
MADTFIIYDESDDELAGIGATAAIALLGLDADLATFSLPASTTISAFGATIVDDANAAAVIATLGLDAGLATFSLPASTTITAFGASLVDDTAASNARTTLEVSYASSAEINTGTEALKVISPDALEGSNPAVKGLYINAIRGAELAPAIIEANWTVSADFIDPIVGGVIDHYTNGWGTATATTTSVMEVGARYEISITVGNSPTTSTFVDGGLMALIGGISNEGMMGSTGTYTYIGLAGNTGDIVFSIENSDTARFGISAISVKKLTEGNLTMNGGQILAQTFVGDTVGIPFKDTDNKGIGYDLQSEMIRFKQGAAAIASVADLSTHVVPMVINGTTYYVLVTDTAP